MAHDKTRTGFGLFALALTLAISACAPSPLYVSSSKRPGTGGEIPRDGRGEPIWTAIHPVAPDPYASPPPVAPAPPAS